VTFVGYTNGQAMIQVSNRRGQPVCLEPEVWVCYANHPFRFEGDVHLLTNTTQALAAGHALQFAFPAPTNHRAWRAMVGVGGQRDIAIANAVHDSWLWRHYPALISRFYHTPEVQYAETEWIAR
jgi:hypothetical protein